MLDIAADKMYFTVGDEIKQTSLDGAGLTTVVGFQAEPAGIAIATFGPVTSTLVVDTISDVVDGTTSTISTLLVDKGPDGFISLREAILATNNTPNVGGPDEIHFSIAGGGPHTILLGSALPARSTDYRRHDRA